VTVNALLLQRCKESEWRLRKEAHYVFSPFAFSPNLKSNFLKCFLNGAAAFLFAPEPAVCKRETKHGDGQKCMHTLLDSARGRDDVHLGQCGFGN